MAHFSNHKYLDTFHFDVDLTMNKKHEWQYWQRDEEELGQLSAVVVCYSCRFLTVDSPAFLPTGTLLSYIVIRIVIICINKYLVNYSDADIRQ